MSFENHGVEEKPDKKESNMDIQENQTVCKFYFYIIL